ncbi:MAG: hypothetical protein JSW50_01665 [Candidatus Latescibacterota bacterium]|nr:MAG: hypothetical protein JSW50_01665 [Candidatus Latescibacterota bacterium]
MRDRRKLSIAMTVFVLTAAAMGFVLNSCSDQTVTVGNNPPALAVSEDRLGFSSPTTDRHIIIWNAGQGTLNWEAFHGSTWLTLTPPRGTSTGTTDANEMIATVDWEGFAPGESRNTSVKVTSNGGNRTITIWATMADGPCSFTFVQPITQTLWTVGELVKIEWTSANTGGFVRLDLYKGGEYLCNITEWTGDVGLFQWVVDDCGKGDGTDYRIHIRDVGNTACWRTTGDFQIVNP